MSNKITVNGECKVFRFKSSSATVGRSRIAPRSRAGVVGWCDGAG